MMNNSQILFVSHGGGPLPLLGDERHQEMLDCLTSITAKLRKPDAILVISAHWESDLPTLTAGEKPPLIYDYYGFPEESYQIRYPCLGEPELARQVHDLLNAAQTPARLDADRGFDHGLFIPLKIMFPDADIPCVQLSLVNNLDPATHIHLGRVLRSLPYDNLVIGSGFSFHNLREFFKVGTPESKAMNEAFEAWLLDTCSRADMSEEEREQRLIHWEDAPHARYCHPREEHLLPLHVCYGLAQSPCTESFELQILGKKSSMYLWSKIG